jgi:hypothetical protein
MEEQEARNWLNMSMSILRKSMDQASMRVQYYDDEQHHNVEESVLIRSKWESLLNFLNIIARKMEDFHQKIVMSTFPAPQTAFYQ